MAQKLKQVRLIDVRVGQGFKFYETDPTFRLYRVADGSLSDTIRRRYTDSPVSVLLFDSAVGSFVAAHPDDSGFVAAEPEFIIMLGDDYYWTGVGPTQVRASAKLYPTREAAQTAIESLPSYIGSDIAGTTEA